MTGLFYPLRSGISKSEPAGPIRPTACFVNKILLETTAPVYLWIIHAAFALKWQSGIVATEAQWPVQPKISSICLVLYRKGLPALCEEESSLKTRMKFLFFIASCIPYS